MNNRKKRTKKKKLNKQQLLKKYVKAYHDGMKRYLSA